jgi:hypothetical protein
VAKLSANGTEVARYQNQEGTLQFSIRSNGKVLRRMFICGKWEGWVHSFYKPSQIKATCSPVR